MNIVGIIPARMGSTRFPNKPMAKILGMPMIGHVYHRSLMAKHLGEVWVATCDREIYDYIRSLGGNAVMTADTHERASERVAEAVSNIEKERNTTIDYALMIQGDEPMLEPAMLDRLASVAKSSPGIEVVNLMARIDGPEEFENSNTVKVVVDRQGDALYFSREPIPSKRKYGEDDVPMWKQLGLILFSRDALFRYVSMEPTSLEIIESVDMNRYLEHGTKIRMVGMDFETCAVDTPEDLARVETLMKTDKYIINYCE